MKTTLAVKLLFQPPLPSMDERKPIRILSLFDGIATGMLKYCLIINLKVFLNVLLKVNEAILEGVTWHLHKHFTRSLFFQVL